MNTAPQTMSDNELIAEFMGYEFVNDAPKEFPKGYWFLSDDKDTDWLVEQDMQYSESWDWLMPVVEKIRNHVIDNEPFGNEYYQAINNALIEVDIHDCHVEVVEFIKWFNTKQ